jgi:sulfur transfer protein SufE
MVKMFYEMDEIIEMISALPDDEEKLEFILTLGAKLPSIPNGKTGDIINGCSSKLEISRENIDGKMHYAANADSRLVGGLAYLMLSQAEGKTTDEISKIDFYGNVSKLELPIGFSRVSGLKSMETFLKN